MKTEQGESDKAQEMARTKELPDKAVRLNGGICINTATQASMVHIRDHVKGNGERLPSLWCAEEMLDAALKGDTTALDAAIASALAAERKRFGDERRQWIGENLELTDALAAEREKAQTLVDALKKIRALVTLRRIHQIVDAALAKVKDGK